MREFDVRPHRGRSERFDAIRHGGAGVPWHLADLHFYLRRPVELDRPGVEQILAGTANGAVIMSRKSWTGLQPKAHPSQRIVPTRRIGNDDMLVPGGGA